MHISYPCVWVLLFIRLFSLFTSLLRVWSSGIYQAWIPCPSWPDIFHPFSWRVKGRRAWEKIHGSSKWLPINPCLCNTYFKNSFGKWARWNWRADPDEMKELDLVWERGNEGRKGGRGSLFMSNCSSVGIFPEFCPFSSVWTRALLLSLCFFYLLTYFFPFFQEGGEGGLWFISPPFLLDFHKAETQRCLQESSRPFPFFLNNDLQVEKLVRNQILLRV